MRIQLPNYVSSLTILIFLNYYYGLMIVSGYRDDSRIVKWSPAWLSASSDPERYAESRFISRPLTAALQGGLNNYYRRLRDEEPPLYKWSPWYFSKGINWKRARGPVAWDGGDSLSSVGSPEWFRDDELMN